MKISRTAEKELRIISAVVVLAAAFFVLWFLPLSDFLVDDTLYAEEIQKAAIRHQIPPELLRALIFTESRFRKNARGGKGEIGLTQIMRSRAAADWARFHRKEVPNETQLFEPELNIEIGSWYLARALRRWSKYKEGTLLALAEYNAGLSRAKRWKPEDVNGTVLNRIDFPSTRKYVEKIWKRTQDYQKK